MILGYKGWSRLYEGNEEMEGTKQVQKFLNAKKIVGADGRPLVVDGLTGPGSNTEAAIAKYQHSIGVWPEDGVWGPATQSAMPPEDRELWSKLSSWW